MRKGWDIGRLLVSDVEVVCKEIEDRMSVVEVGNCEATGECFEAQFVSILVLCRTNTF